MLAIRSALFLLFQVTTVIPWSFVCILSALLPLSKRYAITMKWVKACIWGAEHICGIRWQIKGAKNIPDTPVVFLSKHQSTWETLFYPSYLPHELCYVFKRELLFLPFFGWGIGLLEMIHINRKKGNRAFDDMVRQGSEKIAEGRSIIMFPEGTRIPPGQIGRYKTGGSRFAVRTGAPVIPIAVNSGEYWPKKAFIKRPGLVTVSFGPAIETAGRNPEELNTEVMNWIEAEMQVISPHLYQNDTQQIPGFAGTGR
ncbi:MAG: lysophospholipid acyltransferase family protein [Burkholderiaceae bacterium]